jgi:hypothetical protein
MLQKYFYCSAIKTWFSKELWQSYKEGWHFFLYLHQKFPRLSEAEVEEGIFVDPHIRKYTKDNIFDSVLNEGELAAWTEFKDVCSNFF